MIHPGAIPSARSGLLPSLLASCAADLRGYAAGVGADMRALWTAPTTALVATTVLFSQLFDLLTTGFAMAGSFTEVNPLSAAVIARWGIGGLVVEKIAVAAVVLFNMGRLRGRSVPILGVGATFVGVAAAAWNLHLAW